MLKSFLSNWRKVRQRVHAIVALAETELRMKQAQEAAKQRQRKGALYREFTRRAGRY